MKDMNAADITGEYREAVLTFHSGSSRKVFYTEIESPMPDGRLIVSRTDLNGNITHANAPFVDMSGYTRGELIGAPHCILRHPDMPAAGFQDLWNTLKQKKKWHGYVKNLRKDGGFYWVYATVIPNIRNGEVSGYTSVRRRPSKTKVKEAEALYRTLE